MLSSFLFVPRSAFASCCCRADLLSFWPLGNIILFEILLVLGCTVARSGKCSITYFIFSHTLNGCRRGSCATGLMSVSMFKSTWILSSFPFFVLLQQLNCAARVLQTFVSIWDFVSQGCPLGHGVRPYQLPSGPRGTWATKKWHTRRSRVRHWCSYHILTSSEICYWTDTRQHGIY